MQIVDASDDLKCCCSCDHNIRKYDGDIECYCNIDNHYIGYVANFKSVCEEWKEE